MNLKKEITKQQIPGGMAFEGVNALCNGLTSAIEKLNWIKVRLQYYRKGEPGIVECIEIIETYEKKWLEPEPSMNNEILDFLKQVEESGSIAGSKAKKLRLKMKRNNL